MADRASRSRPDLAVAGHLPSNPANYCALDAALCSSRSWLEADHWDGDCEHQRE